MNERFEKVIAAISKKFGLPVDAIAIQCGVSDGTLRGIIKKRVQTVSHQLLADLKKHYGVNIDYIVDGTGPIFSPTDGQAQERLNRYLDFLEESPVARKILDELMEAGEEKLKKPPPKKKTRD